MQGSIVEGVTSPAGRVVDPIYAAVDAVGDAWSWLILREAIFDRVQRYRDFQAGIGIPNSTLSARLKRLVMSGLLERRVSPRRYELTPMGEDFFICLMAAMRWGDRWCSGGRPRPVRATHNRCRAHLDPVFRCSACSKVVVATEVAAHTAPHARTELVGLQARQREPVYQLLERVRPCSIARTLTAMGDRWTSLVVRESFLRARRFDDYQARLGIASNILAHRLKRLVDIGVLARVPYQERPLRHEYRLTVKGLDFYSIPLSMLTWAARWLCADRPRAIQLTHSPCRSRLEAVLMCDKCGEQIVRRDVTFARSTSLS
jgi:DNA-binding HxlR family transcriptional regulator